MTDLYSHIKHMNPCSDAVKWLGDRTLEEAWTECERGDWMLWLAEQAGIERKLIVLTTCDCVEPALEFAKGAEAETAIKTARLWCDGRANLNEVMAAAQAVDDALDAYDAVGADDAAAYAVDAVDHALDAAFGAAESAAYAAYDAARAAAHAAHADAAYAAFAASLKHSAELVRARIPVEVVREALKGERDD